MMCDGVHAYCMDHMVPCFLLCVYERMFDLWASEESALHGAVYIIMASDSNAVL